MDHFKVLCNLSADSATIKRDVSSIAVNALWWSLFPEEVTTSGPTGDEPVVSVMEMAKHAGLCLLSSRFSHVVSADIFPRLS